MRRFFVSLSLAGVLLALAPPASAMAASPARFLVVTVTTGFRHGSIDTAEPVLEELGRKTGLFHADFLRMPPNRPPQPRRPRRGKNVSDADWAKTEAAYKQAQQAFRQQDMPWQKELKQQFATAFSAESLAQFDGVMFISTTGELPIPDLGVFLDWLKAGHAFVGVHAATDTLKSSDAYVAMVGGNFAGHPWLASGEHGFVNHEPTHPVVAMYPERFRWKDEIYQYGPRYQPENVRVLLSIDMAASSPKMPWHVPVSWVRDYGRGRVFYTNLGHNDATWKDEAFRTHLTSGIAWSLGQRDGAATANPAVQAAEYLRSVLVVAAEAAKKDHDALRAQADAKIAADPSWAVGLRPQLLAIRSMQPDEAKQACAMLIAEIEKD
jgi:type 1 glutamine amidotransferase